MKKRILAGLLAVGLTASLALSASAESADVPMVEKAAVLKELEIMVGDQNGALNLNSTITRGEFVKMLVAASPYKDNVSTFAGTDPYPDVSHTSWYAPYVRLAVDQGLVQGDLQGYFHPEAAITLAEGVTMAVRLLGYADGDFTAPWPAGQMGLYRSLKLGEGIAAAENGNLMTRGDCLHLFYNLLTAKTKTGTAYINQLGYSLNADGEVDVNAVFDAEVNGPIPLTDGWEGLLPFDVNTALVYRDGERAELSELKEWDLVYWIDDPALLIVYSDQGMSAVNAKVEGPIEVKEGWEAKLPFGLSEAASITRNGARAAAEDIQEGDLVYYAKDSKSLAVYRKRVSGTVEAVSPSAAAPTAVVIAGQSYALETLEAQYAFSDLGQYKKGDAVTLLLGRGGGAAAVKPQEEDGAATHLGVLVGFANRTYTNAAGQTYASKAVELVGADGKTYTYPCTAAVDEDKFDAGDLIEVTQGSGRTTVQKRGGTGLSGKVSATAEKIGNVELAADAEILDTYGDGTNRTVAASRLAGVTLKSGDVRGYVTDESGRVTQLFLNDVTGDAHSYGVLTEKETVDVQMILQGAYTVDIGGESRVYTVSGKRFSADKGPVVVKNDGGSVKDIRNLNKLTNVTLTGQTIIANGKRYTLADNAAFYRYDAAEKEYTLLARDDAEAGGTLTAYYDKTDGEGGRVRVIVVQAN